jgi:hypothetical protein
MSYEDIPHEFICPITRDIMNNPYIAEDGHTYQKEAIIEWFKKSNRSPSTNLNIGSVLIKNIQLKQLITKWIEEKEAPKDLICGNCIQSFSILRKCEDCKLRMYCCKKCQREDWHKNHKKECGDLTLLHNKITHKYQSCSHLNICVNKTDFNEITFTCLSCGMNENDEGILCDLYLYYRNLKDQSECEHEHIECSVHKIIKKFGIKYKSFITEYKCYDCEYTNIDKGILADIYKIQDKVV